MVATEEETQPSWTFGTVETPEQIMRNKTYDGCIHGGHEHFEHEFVVNAVHALIRSHEYVHTLPMPRPKPLDRIRLCGVDMDEEDWMHLVENLPNMHVNVLWLEAMDQMPVPVAAKLIEVLPLLHLETFHLSTGSTNLPEDMVHEAYVAAMRGGVKRLVLTMFETHEAFLNILNAIRQRGEAIHSLDVAFPNVELTDELFQDFITFVRERHHIQTYRLLEMDYDHMNRHEYIKIVMRELGKQVVMIEFWMDHS